MSGSAERLQWDDLQERVRSALPAEGTEGELASRALVEAQALGMPQFGVGLLRTWRGSGQASYAPPEMSWAGSIQHWQVDDRFGPLLMAQASHAAMVEADDRGLGVVVLHGLGGSGRLAPYVEALASHGQVGAVFASSPPLVAAHGGSAPLWGTNPFALAVPGPSQPLSLDASTAAITAARLKAARAAGARLPDGVAVDAAGLVVTDPDEVAALLPRGGLMGTLAAVLVEGLTSGLAGKSSTSDWRAATVMAFATPSPVGNELRARIAAAEAAEPGGGSREALISARAAGVDVSPEDLAFLDSFRTH